MAGEDAHTTRMIHREIGRRNIDITKLDIKAMHGVVYLRGSIQQIRGYENIDLKKELEVIHRMLRTKPGIREVIIDVEVRG